MASWLQRPVDVEEAENYWLQRVLAAIEVQIVLTGQLVRSIRGQRRFRRVFNNRLALTVVAIHRSAGGKHHSFDARFAHGFAHIERADKVALVSAHRVVYRGLHRGHRGQVHDCTAAGHGALDQGRIGDVAFNEFDLGVIQRQVVALACRHIVEDSYGMPFGQQAVHQIGTDKTGTAGD